MPSKARKPNASMGGMLKTGFRDGGPSASTSHGQSQGGAWRGGTPINMHIKAGRSTANQGGELRSGYPADFGIKGGKVPGRPHKIKRNKMY